MRNGIGDFDTGTHEPLHDAACLLSLAAYRKLQVLPVAEWRE